MKILVTQRLKDFAGSDILDDDNNPRVFRDIVSMSLTNVMQKEQPMTAEKKNACFQLGLKLYRDFKGDEIDFTFDEVALMKERVNAVFANPLVCGRIAEIIENASKDVKPPTT